MAHIQKRGPHRWVARYTDPAGKERAQSFERKVDAERFLTGVQHSMFSGSYVDPAAGQVTFAAYAERWRAAQPHRPTTARTVERHLRVHALPTFGPRPLASIRPSDVQAWTTALVVDGGLAASTARAVFENVRAVFRAAMLDRIIVASPCDAVTLPKVAPPKVEPLSRETVRTLIEAMDRRYRALIILAVGSGLRSGELFGLQVRDVDFLRRTVTVERQLLEVGGKLVLGAPKTASSHRTVPISTTVVEELAAHLRRYPAGPDEHLFRSPSGGPTRRTNFIRGYWLPAAREAGIPSGTALHALRHTYASVLISGGLSVKVVSSRLGHTNAAQTLNVYAHLFPDDEDRTRAVIDELLGAPATDARRTAEHG